MSEDSSAADGGFLGPITRGRWAKAAGVALFALEVGEVSGIVETERGFHIFWRKE
jgi:peptidyl-prolyl cis-trans isomerase C